ncbi:MAG: 4'-phosphopantetheinyl transferase superfamily protein [Ginsengibacter sp.]
MPLFYQHTINQFAKLAVWHITEPEEFFSNEVSIQNVIAHAHKRIQHLAGRYLLKILKPDFPFHQVQIHTSKKPLLNDEAFHFSISHCGDYAAAIISEQQIAGIDVEIITPKIDLVKNKFLTDFELSLVPVDAGEARKIITLFWSSKESIYKWYGKGALSFKRNMGMEKLFIENDNGFIDAHFIKEEKIDLKIEFQFFDNLCLAWVLK